MNNTKLITLILGIIILVSCSEDSDNILIGNWKGIQNNYRIVLSEEYDYVEIFSKPWIGTIMIDEVLIEFEELNYIIDNSMGQHHLCSDVICIHFYYGGFTIYYQENNFTFSGSFLIDILKGELTAEGIGINGDDIISIKLNLNAQKTLLLKDKEYSIKDGLYHEKNPYWEVFFGSDNYLNGKILLLDILSDFSGEYSVNSKKLYMDYTANAYNQEFRNEYSYELNTNDTLKLYENIDYRANDISLFIPNEIISTLQYERVLIRK